ncbi:hypothetical protein GCM10010112_82990 [Actinoplanes lobatus]|uniref:TrbL/VirB6 plasmid conjugal transfer protein n=1 Tax=Actinoplanes lobatus TaxID=113568 RepID=A0A7W7HL24_9ACTN|nr:hypothetical protein [Actinoplanes lobatus]MBB4752513.1 hypothetical protein [Actinoplanes lobatus]GGN94052.1 hypothetical protein GCM10010112_82990 [Actinoplanes lobatus]GIE44813.1 hypothetical protein Alo02nite_77110 [Actinoplanes lobatus]
MAGLLYDGLTTWLAERVQQLLTGLLALLSAELFTTPDVTGFPQVQQLAGRSATIVNAAYLLMIIAAGVVAMGHGGVQIQYEVKDLLPRLVFGMLAANVGVEVCRLLIDAANAITTALTGETGSGLRLVEHVRGRIIAVALDPAARLMVAILAVLFVVLLYLLLVGWFARVALLIVLAGIAPLALACHGLPHTQPAAVLWWRSLLGCLAVPGLQALFLSAGVELLLGPTVRVPELLGLTAGPAGWEVANLFIAVCLLWVTVRIPGLVGRYVTGSRPHNPGVVLKAAAVQAVTRGLRLPGFR